LLLIFSNCVFETAEKRIKEEDEDFVQLLPEYSPCDGEVSSDCTDPLFSTVMSHGSHLTKLQTTDSVKSDRQDFTVNKHEVKDCSAAGILATLRSLDSQNAHDTPQLTAESSLPTECASVINTNHSVETGRSQLSFENDNKDRKLHKVLQLSRNTMDTNSHVAVICKPGFIEPSSNEVSRVGRENVVETPQSTSYSVQPKECQLIEPSTSEGSSRNMNKERTLGEIPERSHSSHSEKRHRCNVCGKKFEFRCRVTKHMTVHMREKPYKCSFCDRKFRQKWFCEKHERGHKGELPQCPVCGGIYVNLHAHVLIHSDDNYKHICSVCEKAFRVPCKLKEHMLTHTEEKPFTCNDCGCRYKSRGYLNKHMLVHTKEKKHVCSLCGKMFSNSTCLKSHMRIHSDERPYHCETCGKAYKCKPTFSRHQLGHSSERHFVCSTCGKKFRQDAALRRHKLIHTGEQPYECGVCRMRFNQSNSMKRHMLIHTGEKPYSCSDCGERFTQSGGLSGHRRRHCPVIKNSQS